MNKLYVIKFMLSNGYIVSTWWTFHRGDLEKKINNNPEWTFELAESNCVHDIYIAK